MSKLKIEVLTDERGRDLSDSNIVLTDGHRDFLGVYICKYGKSPKKYVERIRPNRQQSAIVYEARAIANGLRIAARQCRGGPIIIANDNSDVIRYAKMYLGDHDGEATSVLRYEFTENDIKIVNGYLEGVRKIAEKRPIFWAEISNSSENDNVAHNLCMQAQARKNNRIRSMS